MMLDAFSLKEVLPIQDNDLKNRDKSPENNQSKKKKRIVKTKITNKLVKVPKNKK